MFPESPAVGWNGSFGENRQHYGPRAAGSSRLHRADGCAPAADQRTRRRPLHRRVGQGHRPGTRRRPPAAVGAGAGEVAGRASGRSSRTTTSRSTSAAPMCCRTLTGFNVHRGALAAMHRPVLPGVAELLRDARLVVVLEDIVDHTNVGAIFRAVAGLGADAVLVTPRCADPLYRRSVRVSMGTVLQVPWTRLPAWPEGADILHAGGIPARRADARGRLRESRRIRRQRARSSRAAARHGGRRAQSRGSGPRRHGRNGADGARRRFAQRCGRQRRCPLGAALAPRGRSFARRFPHGSQPKGIEFDYLMRNPLVLRLGSHRTR